MLTNLAHTARFAHNHSTPAAMAVVAVAALAIVFVVRCLKDM